MQHVNPKIVLSINVSAKVDQELTSVWITLEGRKMQRSEPVTIVLLIDPFSYLLLCRELGFSKFQECLKTHKAVAEGALV